MKIILERAITANIPHLLLFCVLLMLGRQSQLNELNAVVCLHEVQGTERMKECPVVIVKLV